MKIRSYRLSEERFGRRIRFALVSDLHGEDPEAALVGLRQAEPDYILMPGDILETLDGTESLARTRGLRLLTEAAKIAPVFYCTGNHEDGGIRSWCTPRKKRKKGRYYPDSDRALIRESGAILLEDGYVIRDGIAFGGLQSGLVLEKEAPSLEWLKEFAALDCPKVLLCHHPEYYEKYLKELSLSLIVSGHAHGGQWRFFGRGVFAPGQGIFPKYTRGVYDGRLVVGTGLKRGSILIPRFFNPTELVLIEGE